MADAAADLRIAEEDELRARWYGLLGSVLAAAPDQARLDAIAALSGGDSEFGEAVAALAAAAGATEAKRVEEEYFDLFIGIGQGELTPYGSYYLTGFLHEKPLARLRGDMRQLGIARADNVKEPEDHIAAVLEMMRGQIIGAFGAPADLGSQRRFFQTHVASWAPRFFEDLEAASSARFYRHVGRIGRLFMGIEAQAFDMAA